MDKARLTGILADPLAARALQAALVDGLKPEAARLEALVKTKTPIARQENYGTTNPPPGTLRRGVVAKAVRTKKGVAVILRADAAKRRGTEGDPPRRYGRVPYGVFVDAETGFVTETMAQEAGRTLEATNAVVAEHCRSLNAGPGTTPTT